MPTTADTIHRLAELWSGIDDEIPGRLQSAQSLAASLCRESDIPAGLLSIAWRLVADLSREHGVEPPLDEDLAKARSAALSSSQSCGLLLDRLAEVLPTVRPPVVVLSTMSYAYRLLGVWNAVPSQGAFIVPLCDGDDDGISGTTQSLTPDIRWASPGRLRPFMERGHVEVEVEGCRFSLPPEEVILVQAANRAAKGCEVSAFLLVMAAQHCVGAGKWGRVVEAVTLSGQRSEVNRVLRMWNIDPKSGSPRAARGFLRGLFGL